MDRPRTSFAGITAVITGGGSGIGRATARLFLERGANVGIVDRDATAIADALEHFGSKRDHAFGWPCDVRDRRALGEAMAASAKRWGSIDMLICAAGVLRPRALLDVTEEELDFVFGVNTKGFLFAVQAALPFMPNRTADSPRSIVAISSASGARPKAGSGIYAASKAALQHLVRSFALELADRGIRVNAIAPGTTSTGMVAGFSSPGPGGYLPTGLAPIGRMGEPEDMASAIAFLCSSEASFISGAILPVDGAMTAGVPARSA